MADQTNVPTIGDLKKAISGFDDDMLVVGNCVDADGKWYVYPVYISKCPGDNNMVLIQLKPIKN